MGGATIFLCILSAACYVLRRRHLISTSDHANGPHLPRADLVNITIDPAREQQERQRQLEKQERAERQRQRQREEEEQERQRQLEEQERAERQRQRQREEEEQKRQAKALSDQKFRWDKYRKSLSLSDLWEGRGRSKQKLYNVNRNCDEFLFVEKLFMKTMCNYIEFDNASGITYYRNSVITLVERVENGMQHDTYTLQKKNIAMDITKSPASVSCDMEDRFVKWLFHGTTQKSIDDIVNSQDAGYLPMLAGSASGAKWGDGTYFARDANYSHFFAKPQNDPLTNQIQRKMLLNRVIVGQWVKGAPGIKEIPKIPNEKHRRYNSLVNDEKDPSIFVIQHSNQA